MSQILARRSFHERPKHTVLLLAGLFSAILGLFFVLFDETVFGVFALFIYLFKSRGFKQGMRASGLALLSLSGLLVIMLLSAFLWAVLLLDVE